MANKKIPVNTLTRDLCDLAEPTGNSYETVVILAKRANQIAIAEKKELTKKLEVKLNAYSASAAEKINAAGGKAEVI